jgi:para-aminobenzoate synthetase component 1
VGESPELRSTCSEAEYRASVARVIEAIEEGDVYQVNLSQRFTADTAPGALPLYDELRRRSPAPYGAFVRAGAACILSSSPERFLRVWPDGAIETRPIKGTRRRGRTEEEDDRLARALIESEKDRAENLMIVDLLRNDLSRVCRPGTIRVPELFRLESWATVHHLVSIVRGRLRDGVGVDRLLAATFPCGSVTGAPKVRAMELIASLERVARGPYCGALGYFGFGGHVDLSVAIRIAVLREGRATFHAGGGIVADSEPGEEYRETVDKARAIIGALHEGGRDG